MRRTARRLRYVGWGVCCPCCGTWAPRFADDYNRKNAKCTMCFSEERHRALRIFLEGWLPTRPGVVLHQAADASIEPWLRTLPGIRYVTGDLGERAADLRYDLEHMPVRSAAADVVIASHVLEHIPDDRAAMAEIFRVLKPGGAAILQVPIDDTRSQTYEDPAVTTPEERTAAYWQFDHVRLYGRDFADRLAAAGFSVELRRPSRDLSTRLARRFGLFVDPEVLLTVPIAPPDEIYVATRPLDDALGA